MRLVAAVVLLVCVATVADACPWGRRCCYPPPVYYYPPCPPPVVWVVEPPPPAPEPKPEPKPVVKVVQEDVAPDGWCHVRGRIVYDGDKIPERKEIPKSGGAYTEDWVVNPKNRGVKNVIVWLTPNPTKEQMEALQARKQRDVRPFSPKEIYPGLSKKGDVELVHPSGMHAYVPHVLATQEGSTLNIRNASQAPDNPKFASRNNGELNPLVPPGQALPVKSLVAERFAIDIESNISPWMRAYLWVFGHPYFAVTDEDGRFHIRYAPSGVLRIVVWQESMGLKGGREGRWGEPIQVPNGKLDLGEIKLKPEK